jgi:hypothetical protein
MGQIRPRGGQKMDKIFRFGVTRTGMNILSSHVIRIHVRFPQLRHFQSLQHK